MAMRIFILCLALGRAMGQVEDQENSESELNPQVVQPLTYGAAIVAEVQRLQFINDVFPPQSKSYYKPYGERTILAIKFPSIPKDTSSHDSKSGYGYKPYVPKDHYGSPPKDHYGSPPKDHYGSPPKDHYGSPPKDHYGSPPKDHNASPPKIHYSHYNGSAAKIHYASSRIDDFELPPEDHYRPPKPDYGIPTDDFDSPRKYHYGPPEPEYFIPKRKRTTPQSDLGVIISQNYIFRENIRDFSNVFKLNQGRPSNELVIELAKQFGRKNRKNYNYFNPYQGGYYRTKHHKPQDPSYVIIAIESRIKTNPNSGLYSFVRLESFTNGTIIFPSPKGSTLTNIPFILRYSEDIHHVFDGYEKDTEQLIPKEKTEIKSFLKLMYELHENIHEEGKEAIARLRSLGDRLQRPRLNDTRGFPPNNRIEEERLARLTNWLYTSTVGLRTLSQSKEPEVFKGPDKGYQHPTTSYPYEHKVDYSPKSVKNPFVFYPVQSAPISDKGGYQINTPSITMII